MKELLLLLSIHQLYLLRVVALVVVVVALVVVVSEHRQSKGQPFLSVDALKSVRPPHVTSQFRMRVSSSLR